MKIRYISDLHFDHKNIIRYDNRPWTDPEEMELAMIELWNQTVSEDDLTFILGDVVWSKKYEDWSYILNQLNGKKFIVKGNHDKTWILDALKENEVIQGWSHQEIFKDLGDGKSNRQVVMNHSPMPFFVNMHHDNVYHLYGHVHISFDYQIIKHVRRQVEELYQHEVRMYNVGCMIRGMGYAPKTLDEIIQIDKENRALEEGDADKYLHAAREVGNDKVAMADKSKNF